MLGGAPENSFCLQSRQKLFSKQAEAVLWRTTSKQAEAVL
jgi:hypothetical protein